MIVVTISEINPVNQGLVSRELVFPPTSASIINPHPVSAAAVDASAYLPQQLPVTPTVAEPNLGYQQQVMDAHLATGQQFHMSAPEYEQYIQYQNYLAQMAAYQFAEPTRLQSSGSFAFPSNTAASEADNNLSGADNGRQLSALSSCHSLQNFHAYQAAFATADSLQHSIYQPVQSHSSKPEIDSSCLADVQAQQNIETKDHNKSKLSQTPGPSMVRNSCIYVYLYFLRDLNIAVCKHFSKVLHYQHFKSL